MKDETSAAQSSSAGSPCCAPDAQHDGPPGPTVTIAAGSGTVAADDMVLIAGGSFLIGSEDRWAYPADGEAPVREVSLDSFRIDPVAVLQPGIRNLRRGDGIRDRGGAIRLVVRLRGAAPR